MTTVYRSSIPSLYEICWPMIEGFSLQELTSAIEKIVTTKILPSFRENDFSTQLPRRFERKLFGASPEDLKSFSIAWKRLLLIYGNPEDFTKSLIKIIRPLCSFCDVDRIRSLIEAGIDPNITFDFFGEGSLLDHVCLASLPLDLIESMLVRGAIVDRALLIRYFTHLGDDSDSFESRAIAL